MADRSRQNDKLRPLWQAGGVVYPSIYMNAGYADAEQRTFVSRVIAETVRSAASESAQTLAFHWAWFDDDCRNTGQKMKSGSVPLSAALQSRAFTAAYEAGADGVVLWG